mmetsp:Transcript_11791/g.21470  ORF Transcript_11791/g.21470 Transcript_11791/m.21470 type:complete len:143 (-) Transcript_11791:90-518(-)
MAKVKLPPQAREAAAKASQKQPAGSSSKSAARTAGVKNTLLKQRNDAAKMHQEMSEKDRAERNRRHAKKEAKKRLENAFGDSRDGVPRKVKSSLIPEEYIEDPHDLAPTRRKVLRDAENLEKLSRPADRQLETLLTKALQNM